MLKKLFNFITRAWPKPDSPEDRNRRQAQRERELAELRRRAEELGVGVEWRRK